MKKFRLATMSRLAMPYLESSRMKFSRQACWYLVCSPKRTALLSHEQQPAEVSCRPQVSAVMRAMTLALVGNQPRSKLDIGRALDAHRVLRAVAFGRILGAVEQRIDRLLAFDVDDAQGLAALEDARPRPFGRHLVGVHGVGWIGFRLVGHHRTSPQA